MSAINWGSAPDWIVAATAIAGVGFGLRQLRLAAGAQRDQLQIAKATLLRELDRDFESSPIHNSRLKLLLIRSRFEDEVAKRIPPHSHDDQIVEIAKLVSGHIHAIWEQCRSFDGDVSADRDKSADEYALIMRLPYWCEAVGHLCRRNLAPLEDVLDLYDQLIILCMGNVREHITHRAEAPPYKNRRFLENALWLYEQALAYKVERETPQERRPFAAATKWNS